MEKMGVPAPKDIYPSLMNLSEITDEKKQKIIGSAKKRTEDKK